MSELFLYKTEDERYLAYMDNYGDPLIYVGAVELGKDGNYYRNLIVSASELAAKRWLDWAKEQALINGWLVIEEDFPFDPYSITIVTFKG